jgi:hypothetical protein
MHFNFFFNFRRWFVVFKNSYIYWIKDCKFFVNFTFEASINFYIGLKQALDLVFYLFTNFKRLYYFNPPNQLRSNQKYYRICQLSFFRWKLPISFLNYSNEFVLSQKNSYFRIGRFAIPSVSFWFNLYSNYYSRTN